MKAIGSTTCLMAQGNKHIQMGILLRVDLLKASKMGKASIPGNKAPSIVSKDISKATSCGGKES